MQKTKLITTIGPATDSPEQLKKLLSSGATIARLNLSHGKDEWVVALIERIKTLNMTHERPLAILLDTKGPEVRTAETDQVVTIEKDASYTMGLVEDMGADIRVDYPHLVRDISVGQQLIIDGGAIMMHVTGQEGGRLIVRAEQSGTITSKRHMNVPGVHLDLPILDEADMRRLKLGIEAGADMIALSFLNKPEDIDTVRAFVRTVTDRYIPLIPKIETPMALDDIDAITKASDGIMIARGDLGMEIPLEKLPTAQRHILAVCHRHGVPCIIATHMLKSMTDSPTPTRAEVLDVGHAVYDGADATMLSDETTAGQYPIEATSLMARIAGATEESIHQRPVWAAPTLHPSIPQFLKEAIQKLEAKQGNLLVYEATDMSVVRLVASLRLPVHCIALTDDLTTARFTALTYGQYGCITELPLRSETLPKKALMLAQEILGEEPNAVIAHAPQKVGA